MQIPTRIVLPSLKNRYFFIKNSSSKDLKFIKNHKIFHLSTQFPEKFSTKIPKFSSNFPLLKPFVIREFA
jgi:hypothetical protein